MKCYIIHFTDQVLENILNSYFMRKLLFVFFIFTFEAYTKLGVHHCTLYVPNGIIRDQGNQFIGNEWSCLRCEWYVV